MVSRAGQLSDSEIRSRFQYLQDQIDALESLNQPTPPPVSDQILYYKLGISELAWLAIGSGLQINDGVLAVNLSDGGVATIAWGEVIGTLSNQTDLQSALDAKQSSDATLTALAALSTAADKLIYATGSDTFSTTDFTAAARNLLDDASASAMRTTLGLVIGTDVEAKAAGLTQIGALAAPGADRILFWDHSALAWTHLTLGSNISITDTTINVSSGTATLGDGDYGDVTVSSSGTAIAVDSNAITDAKLRDSAALSVIGRSANSSGDPADIVAANDAEVLRRSGTTIGFGTIATAGIANDAVTYAKMQNVSATDKVLGRSTSGAGDVEEITCTAAGRALIDDADASAQRTTLGLVIGTNVEAYKAGNVKVMIPFVIDGGGEVITTGIKGDIGPFNFACTIDLGTLLADQSGSIVIDVWKDSYANFPPTDADSITASAPLTISAATKSQDSSLTGWTKTIAIGDILRINVDSCSGITRVQGLLSAVKT